MITQTLSWQEKLAIIDDTMRAISGVSDPEEMVHVYWQGIGKLIKVRDYVATTRRGLSSPFYLITRSSRFVEHLNPWTQRDQLPRLSGGVLGEVAYANRPVMIYDLPDRLTADDPARFYLEGFQSLIGLPQYDNGEGLNVTAMLFRPGIEIDHSMIPMLHWQSGLFGRGTQNMVLKNQLSTALNALEAELQVVGDIQRSLLPAELPRIPGFDLAASYRTSARAGGDYYDFFPLDDGSWGIFIADVSGHGTPAAVLMAITHAIAHSQPGSHTPPAMLLQYLNEQLARSYTQAGTFVTAFYAILDPTTRQFTYSRAGHNPPRVVRSNRVLSLDRNGALPLGIVSTEKFGESVITLEPGDLLVIYTDGITEARSPANGPEGRQFFDTDRLDKLLLECTGGSAAECVARIQSDLNVFCDNAPPTDDQTLIAIRCL
jgi:sigma-B regulation protein RsbU (phosphoserine phosphatase)